jgi:hypothetical protein
MMGGTVVVSVQGHQSPRVQEQRSAAQSVVVSQAEPAAGVVALLMEMSTSGGTAVKSLTRVNRPCATQQHRESAVYSQWW